MSQSCGMMNNIEMITWWFARCHYENKAKGLNIPAALKYLIRNFLFNIFNSKILTMKQNLNFMDLLSKKISNIYFKKIKLLYRASENEYLSSTFHESCDGKGKTIIIIKNNFDNIFGGYTTIPWSSDGQNNPDRNDKGQSFLFLLDGNNKSIKYPKIWDFKKGSRREVAHVSSAGPSFGADIIIVDQCNKLNECVRLHSFCLTENYIESGSENVLCGGNLAALSQTVSCDLRKGPSFFIVKEYEVFQID